MRRFLLLLFIFFSFSIQSQILPPFYTESPQWADSILNSLSLEGKIGQLIMVQAYSNRDDKHLSEVAELVTKYKVGGIIFFQGGPVRQAYMTNYLQYLSKVPLFIGIDGEWGLSMRLDSTIVYPKQIMLGAIQNDSLIYQMGVDISRQLKRMGIHMNFAPVADINNNPLNPVIGSRSFGENKEQVTKRALLYMNALQDNRIIATAKHFPGHGDTETDSHYNLPVLNHSSLHIDSFELFPFRKLIEMGVGSIMTAHLQIPSLDSTPGMPASLSPLIVTRMLQNKMGYKGIIFTDALNMKGAAKTGKPWDVAMSAFAAGNDILLMPDEVPTVIQRICDAVLDSIIPIEEIDRRCKKILLAKKWVGLDHYQSIEIDNLVAELNSSDMCYRRQQLIEESLTVLKNNNNSIPIKSLNKIRIATLSFGIDSLNDFHKQCDLYANMSHFFIGKKGSVADYDSLFQLLDSYNLIIASFLNTDIRVTRNFGVNDYAIERIKQYAKTKPVILTLFASPYVLAKIEKENPFQALLMAYEDKAEVQKLSAQLLFGGIGAKGKLPVTPSESYAYGDGIDIIKPIRLKYTYPEELSIASEKLHPIDSIINDAINRGAMPGCQVLLAKDGKIFYNKSFGYHTYDKTVKVSNNDIYDIASITKIAATVPSIIKLYDNGDIHLNKTITNYLPELRKSDKKNISLKELLLHQSGLQAWMPFYLAAMKPIDQGMPILSKKKSDQYSRRFHDSYIYDKIEYNRNLISNDDSSRSFTNPVADNLYASAVFSDTILKRIQESKLNKKEYKYSDLGFILLHRIVEKETTQPFESYLNSTFYAPLGLQTMCFNPLRYFDKKRIVPTEIDSVFRKQLIHGYVNDANCAMMGGISGHAGLFSNANDLAILMQMYLNKGIYGGQRYLNARHFSEFTHCYSCNENRRGLGFDKPEPDTSKSSPVSNKVSLSSFGHTGFTGVMVWVDPELNLVYVFLSNRVHPDPFNNKLVELNVRTKIQDVVYDLIRKVN